MFEHFQNFTKILLCYFFTTQLAWAASLASSIDTLIQKQLPKSHVGIVILDGITGKTLYSHNGDNPFAPASTNKILPAAASLFILGPDYQFTTTASINPQQLQDQTLNGNLTIKFSGDPSLTLTDVRQLVKQIKESGISIIKGNVIVDSSRFVEPFYAPGWTQDSLTWNYSAPISAITINENSIPLQILPGSKIGDPVVIKEASGNHYVDIVSNAITTTYNDALQCPLSPRIEGKHQISFNGCWPIKRPTNLSIALNNPDIYAQRIIAKELRDNNIALQGSVKNGTSPDELTATLKVVAAKKSEPLAILLKHMLKKSDNLYTENLVKAMGSTYAKNGSFHAGVKAMKAILSQKFKMDFNNAEVWDGSGQSRYNLITPAHLADILYGMYHTPQLSEVFQQALSISGTDGSLRFRMGEKGLLGRIHAKTGTLNGVSALTGYVYSANGRPYIFAIIVNQIVGKNYAAKNVQNEICKMLALNKISN